MTKDIDELKKQPEGVDETVQPEGVDETVQASREDKIKELVEENEDLRLEVEELRKLQEKTLSSLEAGFTNPVRLGNEPLYKMDEDEFLEALEMIDDDHKELRTQAILERKQYLKKNKPALETVKQLDVQRVALWSREWEQVRDLFLSEYPNLKSHIGVLDKKLTDDVKNPGKLAILEGSIQAKVRWVSKSIKELGLLEDEKTGKSINASGVSKPASTGTSGNKKIFTRDEIRAMSQSEYEKHEAEIDKQLAAGKIR